MPIHDNELSYEEMKSYVDKGFVCAECFGLLTVAWGGSIGYEGHILRCAKNIDHKGIAREAGLSPYDIPGFNLFNLDKGRKKRMEEQIGKEKTQALAKYAGVASLTKRASMEILDTLWPNAPKSEKTKAALICVSYGLNPLMNHVFLIPFNKGKPNETWATVMGIRATRLLAKRNHNYGYIDNTPRIMTDKEQKTRFGEVDEENICVITILKDMDSDGEAPGYGTWPKADRPYGTEKGNSKFNMASIRSERHALERLYPGEMPQGIEIGDERFIEGEYTVVDKGTGEITETPNPEASKEGELSVASENSQSTAEPPVKDERPVTEKDLADLKTLMTQAEVPDSDIATFCNVEKKWKVSQYKDLKVWQLNEIIAKIKKGKA